MTNTIIIERDPRVYLSIARVAIPTTTSWTHRGIIRKSRDYLYSYPVTDITFDNIATSILYPSVHMSCGANELVTVIIDTWRNTDNLIDDVFHGTSILGLSSSVVQLTTSLPHITSIEATVYSYAHIQETMTISNTWTSLRDVTRDIFMLFIIPHMY